jgi:acyl-CoA thioester hydrolase
MALTKDGIKYVFHHDIFRASDNALCFRGKVELVCIVDGRLANSPDYDAAFAKYIEQEP